MDRPIGEADGRRRPEPGGHAEAVLASELVSDLVQIGQLLWREYGRAALDVPQNPRGGRLQRPEPVGFAGTVQLDVALEPIRRLRRRGGGPLAEGPHMEEDRPQRTRCSRQEP